MIHVGWKCIVCICISQFLGSMANKQRLAGRGSSAGLQDMIMMLFSHMFYLKELQHL